MITYWHNPRCSKSRAGLAVLQERGAAHKVRLYLQDNPNAEDLRSVHRALNIPVIKMLRAGEPVFKELGLGPESSEETLIAAMVDHPILIERPIAVRADKAVIGRPTEAIETLL